MAKPPIYGIAVEFESAAELVAATTAARDAGYKYMEGYSPFPIEEMAEALDHKHTRLPFLVLIGGLIGCVGGFFLQYYAWVIAYPMNVGGRPNNSWPLFIPVTFECTILAAALTAVLGMLALNGLPQPYHPMFHLDEFSRASSDRFFLCIQSRDEKFDREETMSFLRSVATKEPKEVPW